MRFKAAANRPAWSVLRGNMGQCCCHKFPLLNHPFGNFSYLCWISHSYERAEPGGPRKLGGFGQYPTCLPRVFRTPIFGAIRSGDQWMRGFPTWEEVMVWRRQGSECSQSWKPVRQCLALQTLQSLRLYLSKPFGYGTYVLASWTKIFPNYF